MGRLCGAQQGGAGYGATPPSRPPLHPPRSTPKEGLSITPEWRGQRGCSSGSFLPSLRSVRRSPSAPRKCQMAHLLWIKSVSADYPDNNYTVKTGRWLKLSRHNNCCLSTYLASLWPSSRARRVDYSPSSSRSESPTARSQWRVVNIICLLQAIIKERLRSHVQHIRANSCDKLV